MNGTRITVQQVNVFADKPDDTSLIPQDSHNGMRKSPSKGSNSYICDMAQTCKHTHVLKIIK